MEQTAFGLVISVTDQKTWGLVARIERHAVSSVELLEAVAFGSEMEQIPAILIELKNMIARVAVR